MYFLFCLVIFFHKLDVGHFQMVDPVLTIAAALSVQSPFHRLLKGGESDVQVGCTNLDGSAPRT